MQNHIQTNIKAFTKAIPINKIGIDFEMKLWLDQGCLHLFWDIFG